MVERHSVNPLFRQLHRIKADAADLVAVAMHRDVEPILLLDRVAPAFVVARRVSLFSVVLRGLVERFAHVTPPAAPAVARGSSLESS
jgi:hypothetical protein